MKLLNKSEYLEMLGASNKVTPATEASVQVLDYATQVWPELGLKKRKLQAKDIAVVYQHGARCFFHVKAFPRRMPETFLIVVTHGDQVDGHILLDIAAEYSEPFLDCPSVGFKGTPTPDKLASLISGIETDDDDPFAILTRGEGTYMQTYRTEDGFILEYQLVTTSCHYEAPDLVTCEQAIQALTSYAFGENEWLKLLAWQLQEI